MLQGMSPYDPSSLDRFLLAVERVFKVGKKRGAGFEQLVEQACLHPACHAWLLGAFDPSLPWTTRGLHRHDCPSTTDRAPRDRDRDRDQTTTTEAKRERPTSVL